MDPISAGLGIAGLGLKIFGGILGSDAAEQAHQAQMNIASAQVRENYQKSLAMTLQSRRQQLDILRNSQRARALALNAATNQGAQFGTGLQGGYGQIAGQSNENLLTNAQSLATGQRMYDLTNEITHYNMDLSSAQTQMSNAQGWSSLGGSLMQSGPTIGNIAKGFGGFNFNTIFGGGSPSGYGA